MSMISELVDKLKKYVAEYNLPPFGREVEGTPELLLEAADTIESLSAKLQAANMDNGGGWIACDDRFPDDMEDVLVFYKANIDCGTHDGEEIHNFGIGYYFSHGNKWSIVTLVKTKNNTQKVIAWQPLPEPYRP